MFKDIRLCVHPRYKWVNIAEKVTINEITENTLLTIYNINIMSKVRCSIRLYTASLIYDPLVWTFHNVALYFLNSNAKNFLPMCLNSWLFIAVGMGRSHVG